MYYIRGTAPAEKINFINEMNYANAFQKTNKTYNHFYTNIDNRTKYKNNAA